MALMKKKYHLLLLKNLGSLSKERTGNQDCFQEAVDRLRLHQGLLEPEVRQGQVRTREVWNGQDAFRWEESDWAVGTSVRRLEWTLSLRFGRREY